MEAPRDGRLARTVTDADLPIAPPLEAPWTLPFAQCPFALVDCEMTGLDPERDALLEVAVARVVAGSVVELYSTLVHTETPIAEAAAALHGIDAAALAGAPAFADVASRLGAMLDGAVPVMHGAELDVRFLDRAFAAAGSPRRVGPALDTVRLARRALNARQYNLTALCATLAIGPVRWHRAAEDVRALIPLFSRLCEAFDPVDAYDLWQVRAGDGRVQVRSAIAKALAAAAGSARPIRLVVRTRGHAERELRAKVLWFRSPHVGLAAVGPGIIPAILRADRVLRVPV
jgi:DNA polymerase III epsilon subunit-like protein